jgi:hypothetical protein
VQGSLLAVAAQEGGSCWRQGLVELVHLILAADSWVAVGALAGIVTRYTCWTVAEQR